MKYNKSLDNWIKRIIIKYLLKCILFFYKINKKQNIAFFYKNIIK